MSVEVTRLPSGLVVITDRMAHLQTASLGVWVGSGSRDERADEHGISHLLEHMAFKGTSRRSAREIAEEIEAVGGGLNAATSVESTAYYARVLQADVPLALDVLFGIHAAPTSRRVSSNRCTWRSRCTACRNATPTCSARRRSLTCLVVACRRGCSRRCAKAGACAIRSMLFTRLIPTPVCSGSTPAPMRWTCPNSCASWSPRSPMRPKPSASRKLLAPKRR